MNPGRPFSNKLTPAEAERLAILMEEMAESCQVIGKILRHGHKLKHPGGGMTNRQLLEKEVGDVAGALALMIEAKDLSWKEIGGAMEEKIDALRNWTHHQPRELLFRAQARAMTRRLA